MPPAIPHFYLYLRPFSITHRFEYKKPFIPLPFDPSYWQERTIDFEEVVTDALKPLGQVVGLGHPENYSGVGKVETRDEGWEAKFQKLARHAHEIIVIPADSPGCVTELRHLSQAALLGKTVFVMPPKLKGLDFETMWKTTRSAVAEYQVYLPEYHKRGLLFQLRPDGSVFRSHDFYGGNAKAFRRAYEQLQKA